MINATWVLNIRFLLLTHICEMYLTCGNDVFGCGAARRPIQVKYKFSTFHHTEKLNFSFGFILYVHIYHIHAIHAMTRWNAKYANICVCRSLMFVYTYSYIWEMLFWIFLSAKSCCDIKLNKNVWTTFFGKFVRGDI